LLVHDPNQARLWDAVTGEPIGAPIQTPRGVPSWVGVRWVGFDNDGKTMLTWNGADVRRWAVARPSAGQKLAFPEEGWFHSAAFSPDGRTVAVAGAFAQGWGVRFWDRGTGKPAGVLNVDGVDYLAYSPDGKMLLTSDNRANVDLWDTATHKRVGAPIPVGSNWVRRGWAKVTISPDGKWVLVARGPVARLYEAWTGKPTGKRFEQSDEILAVALSPDGKRVLTGGDKTARLWDAETGRPLGTPMKHPASVDFVGFSPDGTRLLTSAGKTARLWDAATGRRVGAPIPHDNPAELPLLFRGDGGCVLAAGKEPATARLWDAATGKPRGPYLRHPASGLAFSPDGSMIVTAGAGGMQVWDTATGRPVGKPLWTFLGRFPGVLNEVMPIKEVESAAFSPDGRALLARTTVAPVLTSEARLFELPQPVEGDAARLRLWAEVITARELDAGGEVADLGAKTWRQRREQLHKLGGPP
jgi:WD40 repeat protein